MDATSHCWTDIAEDNPIALLTRRSLTGEKMMVARVKLEKGCHVQRHRHESEQISILLSGHVRWFVGEEGSPEDRFIEMRGGEVLVLPSNVWHGLDTLEDTEVI